MSNAGEGAQLRDTGILDLDRIGVVAPVRDASA
jgi:hypothetical protein